MFLIIILILLLLTSFILFMRKAIKKKRQEGLDNPPVPTQYQAPPASVTTDPLYLTTLNASNISFLKSKVDDVLTLKQQVTDISGQVATMSTAIQGLSTQLSTNVSSGTGCDPTNPSACPLNKIATKAVSA
jgi:hypothetical protein